MKPRHERDSNPHPTVPLLLASQRLKPLGHTTPSVKCNELPQYLRKLLEQSTANLNEEQTTRWMQFNVMPRTLLQHRMSMFKSCFPNCGESKSDLSITAESAYILLCRTTEAMCHTFTKIFANHTIV